MPFFGIPIRNGLPIGLGSVAGFGVAPEFSPADLFLGGVNGAWYDPSDSTTLFSDTAGTTPVAQPGAGAQVVVGLMLDKSQNGVGTNGSKRLNLLTYSGDFSNAAWTKNSVTSTASKITPNTSNNYHNTLQSVTYAATGYTATIEAKADGYQYLQIILISGSNYVEGIFNLSGAGAVEGTSRNNVWVGTRSITALGDGYYRCVVTVTTASAASGSFQVGVQSTSDPLPTYAGDGTSGILVRNADLRLTSEASTAPTYQPITSSWYATEAGNHAISYNTTTARPELSARVNLLTYSEQFDNAAWTKAAASIAVNSTTAPDGTATADTFGATAVGGGYVYSTFAAAAATYTMSVYAKANTANQIRLDFVTAGFGNGGTCVFTLTGSGSAGSVTQFGGSTGYVANITSVGNGWYRCSLTGAATATTWYYELANLANGQSVFIWGAQLTAVNQFPANTYQRIADQYTYDNSASFPRYLRFDGVDDGMSTPANLNLTSTDKATVFAGVRKLTAGTQQLVELSSAVSTNNGSFSMPSDSGTGTWATASKGTNPIVLAESATNSYVAPISTINTAIHNLALSSNVATLRVNGSQVAVSGAGAGGGNFGTYPLYIGSRGNASLWFNGNIYSLIVRGAATDASTISATETWVAGKTGITI